MPSAMLMATWVSQVHLHYFTLAQMMKTYRIVILRRKSTSQLLCQSTQSLARLLVTEHVDS